MANPAKVRTASGTWVDLAIQVPDLSNYSTTTQMNTAISNADNEVTISSGSFSAVTAVNLSNSLSDTYRFYRLYITGYCSTSSQDIRLRFRENTTDVTTGYYGSSFYADYTGAHNNWNARNNGSDMAVGEFYTDAGNRTTSTVNITRASATNGIVNHISYGVPGSAGFFGGYNRSGMTNLNGITFFVPGQTMTGEYIFTGIKA